MRGTLSITTEYIVPFKNQFISFVQSAGFKKYLFNTGWLSVDRIMRLVVGLLVGVYVARYLGPTRFGLLNYTVSFVTLFAALSTLGLDNIVVRELVKDESLRDHLLGTAFWLKVIVCWNYHSILKYLKCRKVLFQKNLNNGISTSLMVMCG